MIAFGKEKEGGGKAYLCEISSKPSPLTTLIILHSFVTAVEQLCAKNPNAPSLNLLRPLFCVLCGQAARNEHGVLQLVGHGMYDRQVRGLTEGSWIVIRIRRFLCLACGRTMSLMPDWLHPWRWYAGTVIVEALYRHCILGETVCSIGALFGRPEDATEWKSLHRWQKQLLISPTLWGWLGHRLGIFKPADDCSKGKTYLERLLAEGGLVLKSGVNAVENLPAAVRKTLRDLVHDRKNVRTKQQFPPGLSSRRWQSRLSCASPTEKDPGPGPP
jgi:hypothetical protein